MVVFRAELPLRLSLPTARAAPNPAVAEHQPRCGGWVVNRHSGSVAADREKLINIDTTVVGNRREVTFHMAGVAVSPQRCSRNS